METIHIIKIVSHDEEYDVQILLRGFRDLQKAKEVKDKYEKDAERILEEVQQYWGKYLEEYDELCDTIRKDLLTKTFDSEDAKRKRRQEIIYGEQDIYSSHEIYKLDKDIPYVPVRNSFVIEELEIE